MMSILCNLCPRKCNVDRINKFGFCGVGNELKVARASLHMWEEPCISGECGSGTVFFSGCSLKCVYCQNGEISGGQFGLEITVNRLADIFVELQDKGAHNLNLVTPDHYSGKIIQALKIARINGLNIPVVYNTSGYCLSETLAMFDGLIDIYLTDFKYIDKEISDRYSKAADYPAVAEKALDEMFRQQPEYLFESGIIKQGVIIRHLVLPNNIRSSKNVLKFLSEKYGKDIYISIMKQYTPCSNLMCFPEINRHVTDGEYERVLSFAETIGFKNVYIQDSGTDEKSFIPPFDNEGVLL